jgi:hypothetical protein
MSERFYILARRGLVARFHVSLNGERVVIWPVAKTLQDALKLSQQFKTQSVEPALIEIIEGESFDRHARAAIADGCAGIAVVEGWTGNGSPIWNYYPFLDVRGEA